MERAIFYLLIFSIPLQARVILFEWTKPLAQHLWLLGKGAGFNQWMSAYLYGTDILLGMLFVFWLIKRRRLGLNFKLQALTHNIYSLIRAKRRIDIKFFLILFLLIAVASITNAQIKGLAWYQLLKLAEFVGFYFYLKVNFDKIFNLRGVLTTIVASGFVQALLGIVQYTKQGSIGLHFLGESPLSVDATGVAVFVADGLKYLRAYGLTPHPNIVAAWLFAATFAFYFLYAYPVRDRAHAGAPEGPLGRAVSNGASPFGLIIYAVLLFGLFFTFSRVIVGLWVLGVLARLLMVFLRKKLKFRDNPAIRQVTLQLSVMSLAIIVIFSALFWPQVKSRLAISANEEAVTQRVFYNKAATQIAEDNPWLGIGLGQFVPEMMEKFRRLPANAYQPVHNIYLLIVSETGFLGFGVFLAFLLSIFRRFVQKSDFSKLHNFSFLIFASSLLIIGLFDHFLWTSQQGSLLFWMALVLISARRS